MDTKRLLTSMLIAGALMLAFSYFFRGGGGGGGAAGGPTTYPLYLKIPTESAGSEQGARPETVKIGGAEKEDQFKFAAIINNVTAGIDKVQLNVREYPETVKDKRPLTLFAAEPGLARPFSTLGMEVTIVAPDGKGRKLQFGRGLDANSSDEEIYRASRRAVLDSQYIWKFIEKSPTSVSLRMTLLDHDVPLLEITKTFRLDSATYDLTVTHTLHNLSDQKLQVRIDQLTTPELCDDPRYDDRFFHGTGLDSAKKNVDPARFNATHATLEKLLAGTKDPASGATIDVGTKQIGQFSDFKTNPDLFVAASNRFFAAVVRPLPDESTPTPFTLSDGHAIPEVHHIASANLDLMRGALHSADYRTIIRLNGNAVDVPPQQTVSEPLTVFLGPKIRDLLKGNLAAPAGSETYAFAAYDYVKLIQFATGCYSFCVFDWLVGGILWLLDFLKNTIAFGNYGVAIMILVVVVRAALHPLTRASQINMAKMGKKMKDIQPKIEAMKKKYPVDKNDKNKQKRNEEMMRIYKENDVNPAGSIMGCLPMLLQMPIWAALYSGLAFDIDLRHASFIPGWINDLSNPDTVFPLSPPVLGHPLFTIPFIGFEIYGLNPLPIFLGVVLFINMKVTMASQPKPADEQQAQMQKMSQYSIFILPFFLYNASSGSNLYFFASTMAGLVDTYFVRKSLKKQGILPASAEILPTHREDETKQ